MPAELQGENSEKIKKTRTKKLKKSESSSKFSKGGKKYKKQTKWHAKFDLRNYESKRTQQKVTQSYL